MTRERKKGFTYSALLHALALLLATVGLPFLFAPEEFPEPAAITVEILPVAPVSNVRPNETAPAKTQEEEKKSEPKPEAKTEPKTEAPKPAPPVKTATPEPEPEPKPEEKEKPEPTKEEPKKEEPKKDEAEKKDPKKEKPKDDPLEAILKSVKQTASTPAKSSEQAEKKEEKTASSSSKSRSTRFDPNSPEALSIRDSISNQVRRCWNVPAGVRDANQLVVFIAVEYAQDGRAQRVEVADQSQSRYGSDPAYRAAAESAKRAVRHPDCNPLKGMPPESYHIWQNVEIRFDPKDML